MINYIKNIEKETKILEETTKRFKEINDKLFMKNLFDMGKKQNISKIRNKEIENSYKKTNTFFKWFKKNEVISRKQREFDRKRTEKSLSSKILPAVAILGTGAITVGVLVYKNIEQIKKNILNNPFVEKLFELTKPGALFGENGLFRNIIDSFLSQFQGDGLFGPSGLMIGQNGLFGSNGFLFGKGAIFGEGGFLGKYGAVDNFIVNIFRQFETDGLFGPSGPLYSETGLFGPSGFFVNIFNFYSNFKQNIIQIGSFFDEQFIKLYQIGEKILSFNIGGFISSIITLPKQLFDVFSNWIGNIKASVQGNILSKIGESFENLRNITRQKVMQIFEPVKRFFSVNEDKPSISLLDRIKNLFFGTEKPEEETTEEEKLEEEKINEEKLSRMDNIKKGLGDFFKLGTEEGSIFTHDVTMENLFHERFKTKRNFWNNIFGKDGKIKKIFDQITEKTKKITEKPEVLKLKLDEPKPSSSSSSGGIASTGIEGGGPEPSTSISASTDISSSKPLTTQSESAISQDTGGQISTENSAIDLQQDQQDILNEQPLDTIEQEAINKYIIPKLKELAQNVMFKLPKPVAEMIMKSYTGSRTLGDMILTNSFAKGFNVKADDYMGWKQNLDILQQTHREISPQFWEQDFMLQKQQLRDSFQSFHDGGMVGTRQNEKSVSMAIQGTIDNLNQNKSMRKREQLRLSEEKMNAENNLNKITTSSALNNNSVNVNNNINISNKSQKDDIRNLKIRDIFEDVLMLSMKSSWGYA